MLSTPTTSLEDLQQIFQKLPFALLLFESDKFILKFANDAALNMLAPDSKIIHKKIEDVFPNSPDRKHICKKVYTTCIPSTENEVEINRPDKMNMRSYFDFMYMPWIDKENNCRGVIVSIIDVTEKVEAKMKLEEEKKELHKTAAALKRSEERYQNYMQQSTEGIWRIEMDQSVPVSLPINEQIESFYQYAHLAECNDAMAKMYGYDSAMEIIGKRLSDFLPRNEDSFQYLKYFIESGYRLEGTESIEKDRDGSTVYFLNNLVGIVQDGFVVRAWGSQLDISEKKKTEEQVRLAKEQLELTLQNFPSAVYLFDKNGQLQYLNDNAARLYGDYTANDLLKQNNLSSIMKTADDMYTRLDENDQLILPGETPVGIALSTGKSSTQIIKVIHKQNKEVKWFFSQASPLLDNDGNLSAVLGTATDITLQKEAEEKIKQSELKQRSLNEELEHIVKDRTRKLAELNRILQIQNETFKQAEESSKQGSYSFNLSTGLLTYSGNLYRLLGYEPDEFSTLR